MLFRSHASFASEKLRKYDIMTEDIVLTLTPGDYYSDLLQGKEMVVLFSPIKIGDAFFSILALTRNPKTRKLMLKHGKKLSSLLGDIIKSFYF